MSSQNKPTKLKRLSIGIQVFCQIFFFAIAVIGINFLASQSRISRDLSGDQNFTLSDRSKKLLRSTLIQEREEPITLHAVIRRSSPHHQRIHFILDQFIEKSKGKLVLNRVDPVRDPDLTEQLSTQYGLFFSEDLLIIDASSAAKPDLSLRRYIPLEDLILQKTNQNKQHKVIAYETEERLSTSLLSACEGKTQKFYFFQDKSNLDENGEDTPWSLLSKLMRQENVTLVNKNLSELSEIPKDAAGIALIAPQYDLEEHELKLLEDYWLQPKSSFLLVLNPAHRPERIRAFLRRKGVSMRNDRILTTENGRLRRQVKGTFTEGPDVNTGLFGQSTVFEGSSGSLEVRENDDELALRKTTPLALIQAGPEYWGETRFREETATLDPQEDTPPHTYLAAAVFQGNAADDASSEQLSKLIVINNTAFLDPKRIRAEQVDFIRNSVDWLAGKEELLGIGARGIRTYKLNLVESEISYLNRINLLFLPFGFILLGLFVWNSRRS